MFRKLHNHFVLTTMSLLTIVLVASFAAIYFSAAARLSRTPTQPLPFTFETQRFNGADIREFITTQRKADADKALGDLAFILILTGGATLTAGFFVSQYLARRAITPVEEAYDRQRQFIADASHELKTPLAVIDASIEAELVSKKKPSKWLGNIQEETSRMNTLVANLLSLAQLDGTLQLAEKTTFDVSELLSKALRAVEPLIEAKSLKAIEKFEVPLEALGDKDKVAQIIMILIDNAIKYTTEGGMIELTTRQDENRVEIIIANSHEPIAEEKLARLFDRFYQADESHHDKGYGLGLAIAKSAAEKSGATLSVTQAGGMIQFTLSL